MHSVMAERYRRKFTADTFVNFQARTGIGADNLSSGNSYNFNPISRNRTLIEWMYRGSWICSVGVDCVADDMTREGIIINSTMQPDQAELLQTALERLQIWQCLNDVAKWARLYGGCLGYMAIDGQDPSTPLRVETIRKGQFLGVTPIDRWMVNPDLVHAVETPGQDFGLPLFYDVVATSFQFPMPMERVHYSRLIRMEGVSLPFWQKQSENMWGLSVLERVYDRLTAFDSTTQGAAQLAFRAYLRTLKIENLRQLIATGGKSYEALIAQIDLIRRYQANEGITLLDAKDDFETHSYTFAGLSDLLNSMGEQISGALQIPLTRLFGQSPAGLNATGESDLRTYYDNIKRLQKRWFQRPLDVLLRVIAASEGIVIPPGFGFQFTPLWQMSAKDKSEINNSNTTAIKTAYDMQFPLPLLMKELRSQARETGFWTNITDADIRQAEIEDLLPDPNTLLGHNGGPDGPMPGEEGEDPALKGELDPNADPDPAQSLNVGEGEPEDDKEPGKEESVGNVESVV